MASHISSDFWWALIIATAIALISVLRLKLVHPDSYRQMNWMDWCGHFALTGVFVIILSVFSPWAPTVDAGVLLLFPLYPIAVLGLLGKLDDVITVLLRAIRRR